MMILRSSPPSPFGRKVEIAASVAGLTKEIDVVARHGRSERNPAAAESARQDPRLVLEDGTTIFDSRAIVEYLDMRAGGDVLIPAEPKARVKALTAAALADGILDAALLQIYEQRFRAPDARSQKWLVYHAEKVARGLATFAAAPPAGRREVAHIGLACALGYLDLRFDGAWRSEYPSLVAWLDAFAADVPAFEAPRVRA
jgi:glutathione S-transferase